MRSARFFNDGQAQTSPSADKRVGTSSRSNGSNKRDMNFRHAYAVIFHDEADQANTHIKAVMAGRLNERPCWAA